MANVQSKQDSNQNTSLFGISGTLGATYGTAETRPLTVTDNGYLNVNASVTAGAQAGGTLDLITRVGSIDTIGTMPTINVAANPQSGTLNTLGTIGTIVGIGTITSMGKLDMLSNLDLGSVILTGLTYPSSTGNNYSGTISAAGTWDGSIETILNQQAAQIEVVADQPYTIKILQYIDDVGSQLSSTDTYTRLANEPFNENITLPGNYFQAKVINTGASTGSFVINTTFGIMNTQSRGPDNLGNFKVGVMGVNGTTLNLGTTTAALSIPVVQSGTSPIYVGTIGSVVNIGSISTIGTMPAISVGNPTGGTTDLLKSGTITRIGSIDVIGTMPAVSSNPSTGTLNTLGTIGTVLGIGGTVQVSGVSAGTNVNVFTGTVNSIGSINTIGTMPAITIGTVPGIGTITNIGSISNIGTMPASTLVMNSGTITTIVAGTQNTLGTVGVINGMVKGTVVGGTNSGGTATGVNPVLVAGTDSNGVVYAMLVEQDGKMHVQADAWNIPGGTLGLVSSVAELVKGTITSVGSLVGVGTISNIVTTSGTVTGVGVVTSVTNIASGTLANSGTTTGVGVVSNLTNGSVNILTGTVNNVGTLVGAGVVTTVTTVGSTTGIGTLSNIGSVNTITSVSNIVGGTLAALTLGTIKINNTPAGSTLITSNTLGTAGAAAFWGTLLAPVGAGTYAYITGFSIVTVAGTPEVAITDNVAGSTGVGVLTRGNFVPGGGIARDLTQPYRTVANGTIAYMVNAGTANINVTYWVSP